MPPPFYSEHFAVKPTNQTIHKPVQFSNGSHTKIKRASFDIGHTLVYIRRAHPPSPRQFGMRRG
jgi:hypothetical protein